ncbi:hypothetical protein A6770_22430 [Nostoc minutum NIES-26]|uniref:Uncharacterized protein n=1 Tax=Nostoc minutum NIES-26 TaxID=1844469 RepID=A0A367R0W1_9NOSO|nr:hypothetical protein A6770_22430 [Nostoc minutum NIES-26]
MKIVVLYIVTFVTISQRLDVTNVIKKIKLIRITMIKMKDTQSDIMEKEKNIFLSINKLVNVC